MSVTPLPCQARLGGNSGGDESAHVEIVPRVSVVMPCLDEARTVAVCVKKALAALEKMGVSGEVVVSDNGSRDDSARLAAESGARVVRCSQRGYGNAIRHGVRHCRGELVIMGDADDSYDFSAIEPFVRELERGAEFVMGNRFRGGIRRGAMPWKNRYIGNPFFSWLLRFLFRSKVGDSQCGLRGFTRSAFERMRLESDGMEFATEMVVKAAKARLPTSEVATPLYPDGRGRAPHLSPLRDGWRVLKSLLMFSPLHLFLLPGAFIAALGLLFLLLPAWGPFRMAGFRIDIHWMAAGALFLLLGLQIIQFGVAARFYTITHRFAERDRLLDWLRRRLRVEHGLLVGGAALLVGLAMDASILLDWVRADFGLLERIRPALIATTLVVGGAQIVFFSFLMGILEPKPPLPDVPFRGEERRPG